MIQQDVQQVKDEVEWVGAIGQNNFVLQKPKLKIHVRQLRSIWHNLPQNSFMGSFENALHSCGASAKPHGPFFFIYIGFFHIG